MHHFEFSNISFNYDADFDSTVMVCKKQTGREMGVPFSIFKLAVASWAASLMKARLCAASPDEVLHNKLPAIKDFSLKEVFTYNVEVNKTDGGPVKVAYVPGSVSFGPYLLIENSAGQSITIDFEAVKAFVSLYVSRSLEKRLGESTPDQLFQLSAL